MVSFVRHETEAFDLVVSFPRLLPRAFLGHAPCSGFHQCVDIGRVGVGVHVHADLRHIRLVGEWHRFLEYFGSADDPDFTAVQAVIRNGLLTGQIQRVIQRIHHGAPGAK